MLPFSLCLVCLAVLLNYPCGRNPGNGELTIHLLSLTHTQNEHGVVVGQLIGDGVLFSLVDQDTGNTGFIEDSYTGNVTICIFKRPDIYLDDAFNTFDFAYR